MGTFAVGIAQAEAQVPTFNLDDPPVAAVSGESLGTLFTLRAQIHEQYDDNALRLGDHQAVPAGMTKGDFSTIGTVGGSVQTPVAAQVLFLDGQYSMTRYARDSVLNADNYALDGGIRWSVTPVCSGVLIASYASVQSDLSDLLVPVSNEEKSTTFDEKGTCRVSDHLTWGLDGGWLSRDNSTQAEAFADVRQEHVSSTLTYAIHNLYAAGIETNYTTSEFPHRSQGLGGGVATSTDQTDAVVFYRRHLTPKLEVGVNAGMTWAAQSGTTSTIPTYGAHVRWLATPKLLFEFINQRTVSTPDVVQANFVTTESQTFNANWAYSPKVTFTASAAYATVDYRGGADRQDTKETFGLFAGYQLTPMVQATVGYHLIDQQTVNPSVNLSSNVFMIALAFTR